VAQDRGHGRAVVNAVTNFRIIYSTEDFLSRCTGFLRVTRSTESSTQLFTSDIKIQFVPHRKHINSRIDDWIFMKFYFGKFY
jgi:hypothetical protein